MNNYTVLLMRPDYMTASFGQDTYLAHVVANGADDAVASARAEIVATDGADSDPDDYYPLFVCLGHQMDLTLR